MSLCKLEKTYIISLAPHFNEAVDALSEVLSLRGYSLQSRSISDNLSEPGLYIIFGLHNWIQEIALPLRYVAIQLEQHGFPVFTDINYLNRLRGAVQVWDYSQSNIQVLQKLGIPAIHVPIGYVKTWEVPKADNKDIDILFFGTINLRRKYILQKLEKYGLKILISRCDFGQSKVDLISRSKVVLNLHYHDQCVLEELRIAPSLAAGCIVVSELGDDPDINRIYQKGYVLFANQLSDLVGLCRQALQTPHSLSLDWIRTRRLDNLIPWSLIEEDPIDLDLYGSYPDLKQVGMANSDWLLWHWRNYGCREGRISRRPIGFNGTLKNLSELEAIQAWLV